MKRHLVRFAAFLTLLATLGAGAAAGPGRAAESGALYRPAPIATDELRAEPVRAAADALRPCPFPSFTPRVGWGIKTMYEDPNLVRPQGGAGVRVGVVDTGVSPHLDIVRRLVKCVDLTPSQSLPPCADSLNHGTLVASVIAADGGADGLGMWGMAPEASIYSYRVCEPNNECWGTYVAAGIYAAIDDEVNIINISLDGPGHDDAIKAAIDAAVAHNILVVVAVGNSPPYSYVGYPAAYREVMSVGAIRENLTPWPFTAAGVNDGDYVREDNEIEVAAPGAAVLAALKSGCWALASGTSLAAPLVTGLAARLWNGDAAATRALIQRAARFHDFHVAGDDTLCGFGLPTLRDFSSVRVINAAGGLGGTVSPSGAVTLSPGASQSFTIVPSNACHVIEDVVVDGISQGPIASYTFTEVQSDHYIRATFATLGPYTIVSSAGPAGSISPSGTTTVSCGGSQSYTITAPSGCGAIQDVKVDGVSQGPISSYTFTNVTGNHTIEATVSSTSTYTIATNVIVGNGTIVPGGVVAVACGGTQAFTFKSSTFCSAVGEVIVDGASRGPVTSYTFTNVRSNHTLAVAFVAAFESTISASASGNGTITPNGGILVPCGEDRTYTMAATPGCGQVERVKVDAVWQGPISSFTFRNVKADHTIQAVFSPVVTHAITATAGAGGVISPSGTASVACGSGRAYTVAPADNCHRIQDVKVDGASLGPISSYAFSGVTAGHTIEATFSKLAFTITVGADAGASITPIGAAVVACGGSQTYAIAPSDACRVITDVQVDGVSVGAVTGYTFSDVRADHTIAATTAPGGLALAETHSGASFGGLSDGAIDLTVTGGVPPYAYEWSHGATSEDVAALAHGDYRVVVTDAQGCASALSITIANVGPAELSLSRPSPNPGSGPFQLRYGIPAPAAVRLSVLDLQGREVAVLSQGTRAAGWSWASWNGETSRGRAPGGVYFIRLRAGGRQIVQRFALVR